MLVVAHHRVGVRCFGLETNFLCRFGRFFTFLKKKKKSHFTFKEEESDKRHAHVFFFFFCCYYCLYSGGEDESAEKAERGERFFVGFDREVRR